MLELLVGLQAATLLTVFGAAVAAGRWAGRIEALVGELARRVAFLEAGREETHRREFQDRA